MLFNKLPEKHSIILFRMLSGLQSLCVREQLFQNCILALVNCLHLFRFCLTVLTLVGVGSILVSIAAFRKFMASPEQGLDDALLRTLESTDSKAISKLLSIPVDILMAFKNAILSVLKFPLQLVTPFLERLGFKFEV